MPVMHRRWKLAIIAGTWLLSLALNLWAQFSHNYLLALLFGLLAVPVPFSVMHRLALGKWPPWREVWRLFATGGREIK